jgi:hypothetical protein
MKHTWGDGNVLKIFVRNPKEKNSLGMFRDTSKVIIK